MQPVNLLLNDHLGAFRPFDQRDFVQSGSDESHVSVDGERYELIIAAGGEIAIQAETNGDDPRHGEETPRVYGSYTEAAVASLEVDGGNPPNGGGPDRREFEEEEPDPIPRLDRDERTLSEHETELLTDMQMTWITSEQRENGYIFSLPHGAEAGVQILRGGRWDTEYAKLDIDVSDREAPGIEEVGDIQRRLAARVAIELFDQKVGLAEMDITSENKLRLYHEFFGNAMRYHGTRGDISAEEALDAIREGDRNVIAVAYMDVFFMQNPQFTMIDKKRDDEQFLDYVNMYDLRPEPRIARKEVRWRDPDWGETALDGTQIEDEVIKVGDVLFNEQIYGPLHWYLRRNAKLLGPDEGYNFELAFREHRDDWIRHVRNQGTNEDGYMFLTRIGERDDDGRRTNRTLDRMGRYNFGPIRKGLVRKIHRLMNLDESQARLLAGLTRADVGEEGSVGIAEEDPVLKDLVERTLEDAVTDEQRDMLIRELKETGRGYAATATVCLKQGVERVRARNLTRRRGIRMAHYLKPFEVAPPDQDEQALIDKWASE